MKTKKKCLALFHEKSLKELSAKETTETYGGITKEQVFIGGDYIFTGLVVGVGGAHMSFKENLSRASAAKQYIMNVELQPRLGESFANPKLPNCFASLQKLKAYCASGEYQDFSKYLNKNGSIKSMSAMQHLGHAVSTFEGKVCVTYTGVLGVGLGLFLANETPEAERQQNSMPTNEAQCSA